MNAIEINTLGKSETEISNLVRLPLWNSCLEKMLAEGIQPGKTYSAEFFEKELKCNRNEMKFGLAISEIRRGLESHGFYLSGRGLKGEQFIILEPRRNRDVMGGYSSAALDALKRGVILGTNTRIDTLSAEDRRRHESMLEKLAMRLVICKKAAKISSVLKKHSPKLLE